VPIYLNGNKNEITGSFPNWNSENAEAYGKLNKSIKRFDDVILKGFIPKPEDVDYKKGWIPRYFIAKSWVPASMVEVSVKTYNNDFHKLNIGAYSKAKINWYISGNLKNYVLGGGKIEGVTTKNKREIAKAKKAVPGIIILRNNLLQFYQSKDLYTNGGEYAYHTGTPYVGLYHIAPGIGPMAGPYHTTGTPHATLYPIDGSDPSIIGDSLGGGY